MGHYELRVSLMHVSDDESKPPVPLEEIETLSMSLEDEPLAREAFVRLTYILDELGLDADSDEGNGG